MSLMCSVLQAGVADVCPVGSVLPLPLWGKLSPNPPAETSKLLGKGLQGKRKNCAVWQFGSTHWLSLLWNVWCRQSVQLCRAGNGLSVLLPSSQQHLWAQRTEEARAALALGEQQPRDTDMTAKSSCAPALPGSRCLCGGQERAGKTPVQQGRACQDASYAGSDGRYASLAPSLSALTHGLVLWWPSSNTISKENLSLEFFPSFAFFGSFSLCDIPCPFFNSKETAKFWLYN